MSVDAEGEISTAGPQKSYGQILKSSALIGGSQVLVILIGIVRTKAMAVLLGPAGFGLMGLYTSLVDLVVSVAGMGISSSGVRQIAEASSSGDQDRIARTAKVLRWTAVLLGLLGATLLFIFSRQASILTFGNDSAAWAVALLSLAVLFRVLAEGQGALLQGTRRIADLARMGVIGALLGTAGSILIVYFLRAEGVAPSVVCIAAMSLFMSWWFSSKIEIKRTKLTPSEVWNDAAALLTLGVAFMASGFLTMGSAYAVRAILAHQVGMEAAGLYSAAWTLGGLYINIILQAMGADFYPRLVGVANNNSECNRLTNEQAQISMLLAAPGVCATVVLAPLVIHLFYSSEFAGAVDTLRWICLGVALRVITWPMGFIIVAKNRRLMFLGVDLAWAVVNVGLTWLFVAKFGLNGAGMAFFVSYLFHAALVYPIVRGLSGFRWSAENLKTGLLFVSSIAAVAVALFTLPDLPAMIIGAVGVVATSAYSMRTLLTLGSAEQIPLFGRLLARFGLTRFISRSQTG
jgi:antigen flippase